MSVFARLFVQVSVIITVLQDRCHLSWFLKPDSCRIVFVCVCVCVLVSCYRSRFCLCKLTCRRLHVAKMLIWPFAAPRSSIAFYVKVTLWSSFKSLLFSFQTNHLVKLASNSSSVCGCLEFQFYQYWKLRL